MAEIVAVKEACGTTVNEVVLTVLSIALRRYAEMHNLDTKGRKLRLVIPVNVRPAGDASPAGNQITFLPVDIPWRIREPKAFLSVVQERVKFSKTAHGAELIGLLGVLLGALPTSLQSMAGSFLSQLQISTCNSICTNVPGPRTPLYLLGHKMLSTYPYVPIGGEMGMNCAVMSYNGTLFVGFTGERKGDPRLVRPSWILCGELCRASGCGRHPYSEEKTGTAEGEDHRQQGRHEQSGRPQDCHQQDPGDSSTAR